MRPSPLPPNIDMNLFVVFQTLMEERSVTLAGERLGKTQSAVSNALKRLRAVFDDPLFVRTPAGLQPTPQAESLGDHVREIVALAGRCLDRSTDVDPAQRTARFAVGAPDRMSLPVFLPFLRWLSEAAPGISVDLHTTDRASALAMLDSGEIDLALGSFRRLPPQVEARDLFREELVCLCRAGHPLLTGAEAIDLDRILSFPQLVVSSAGDRKAAFDEMLAGIGRSRIVTASVGNFTLVPELLTASDLIGVYTRRIADHFAARHGLATHPLPLQIEPILHQMAWHRRHESDRLHGWFREQLTAHCAGPV